MNSQFKEFELKVKKIQPLIEEARLLYYQSLQKLIIKHKLMIFVGINEIKWFIKREGQYNCEDESSGHIIFTELKELDEIALKIGIGRIAGLTVNL